MKYSHTNHLNHELKKPPEFLSRFCPYIHLQWPSYSKQVHGQMSGRSTPQGIGVLTLPIIHTVAYIETTTGQRNLRNNSTNKEKIPCHAFWCKIASFSLEQTTTILIYWEPRKRHVLQTGCPSFLGYGKSCADIGAR